MQSYVPPGGHRLPPLPYPYNALEPVISERTLHIHHDRHHLSYVEGLNNAELKLVEARRMGDFSLVKHWEREIAFNGSGHILHSIYWTVMAPPAAREPGYYTMMEIEKYFGSFTSFKEQFTEASIQVKLQDGECSAGCRPGEEWRSSPQKSTRTSPSGVRFRCLLWMYGNTPTI